MEPGEMSLNLSLDFACVGCTHPVGLTIRCEGLDGGHPVAAVLAPCPSCGQVNHVMFDPDGVVRSVRRYLSLKGLPAPSEN
jgi:hypothetical protein